MSFLQIFTKIEETPKKILLQLLDRFEKEKVLELFIMYERSRASGEIDNKKEFYYVNNDTIRGNIKYTKEDVIKQLFYNKIENLLND